MNTYGDLFKVSIFGESHGDVVGVIIDGVKPGIVVDEEELYHYILRRQGTIGATKRKETDIPHLLSGVFNGMTTGAPINVSFYNSDQHSADYADVLVKPRPGHADFVANVKYQGFQDYRGGGHFSGRMTLGIVAAGYFALKMIPFEISSSIKQIGTMAVDDEEALKSYVREVEESGNSVGGIIELVAKNMEIGIGEPFFNSVESKVSSMMFSIPAVKGVEFGIGFVGIDYFGQQFNDMIIDEYGHTSSNNNGGVNGGITNGNELVMRVFVKPTPSISLPQKTYDFKSHAINDLVITGRHDACIAMRVPVVLEAGLAIALCDLFLCSKRYK